MIGQGFLWGLNNSQATTMVMVIIMIPPSFCETLPQVTRILSVPNESHTFQKRFQQLGVGAGGSSSSDSSSSRRRSRNSTGSGGSSSST